MLKNIILFFFLFCVPILPGDAFLSIGAPDGESCASSACGWSSEEDGHGLFGGGLERSGSDFVSRYSPFLGFEDEEGSILLADGTIDWNVMNAKLERYIIWWYERKRSE